MSSFSRLRENLKVALMTTAIAAVTSVSFVEAEDKAPPAERHAQMSEQYGDPLSLAGYDADGTPNDEAGKATVHQAPISKMSMKMQLMDMMMLAPDTQGTLRGLRLVETAYDTLQEADKALKEATISMITSEGYVLGDPESSHLQSILEQHQTEYTTARTLAEKARDHFVETAHSARDKGADIGKFNEILPRTKARDYHLVSLEDVEAAEHKLAHQTRSCLQTKERKWACD